MDRALLQVLRAPLTLPATALEESQGSPYAFAPRADRARFLPRDAGLDEWVGWINPYKISPLINVAPDTAVAMQALPANFRRAYLIVQNKGPGNLFLNFGFAPSALNSLTLVSTQVYEIIGGGVGGAFVPRDSVWLLTDLAGTTVAVAEGVVVPTFTVPRT